MQHLGMQEKQWTILLNDTYWHKSYKVFLSTES